MGTEVMSCCGALTRIYSEAGERVHKPGCSESKVVTSEATASAVSEIDFTVSDGTSEEIQRSDLFTVCQAALSYAQHLKDTAGQALYPDSDAYNLVEAEKIRLAVQRLREES